MVSAVTRKARGRRRSPRAGGLTSLLIGVVAIAVAAAAQADSGERPDATEHLLIGLTPDQTFEVLCDDTPLFTEPVVSDALGVLAFEVDGTQNPAPNTICVSTDGSPPPLRVEGEHACEAGDIYAVICWQTNRPATSQVEYGPTPAYGSLSPLSTYLVRDHAVTIGPLLPETAYHYRAISVDAYGGASVSGDRTLTTHPSPPQVLDVSIIALDPTFFTVAWNTSEPCAHFVEYGPDVTYGSMTPFVPDLVTEHEATVDGLTSGLTYHYRIWSIDGQGLAFASGDFAVGIPFPLFEVSDVAVEHVAARSITLGWTTTELSDSQVEYGPDGDYGSSTEVDPALAKNHTMTVEGLEPGSTYHLRAVSTDVHGSVAVSQDLAATTLDLEVTGLDILEPTVVETTATTATLEWETTNPAFTYVAYGETPDCDLSTPETVEPRTTHQVALTGLSPRTLHYFRIHARDVHGQETASSCETFMTKEQGGSGALAIVWVAVTELEATHATVAWQTNSSSTSTVEYGTSGPDEHSISDDALVTLHAMTLGGLLDDTTYYYRVRSTDDSGQEAVSDVSSFRTPPVSDFTPPAIPAGLVADPCVGGIELAWQANAEADLGAYRVYRRSEGETIFRELAEVPASATGYVDEYTRVGRLYDYTIAAVDLAGNESEPCAPVRAAAGLNGAAMVWVFPNPVRDGATIRFAAPGASATRGGERSSYAARIYDARGRVVRTVAGGRMSADVESVYWDATDAGGRRVASGVYFCVVSFPNTDVRTKLMVVR